MRNTTQRFLLFVLLAISLGSCGKRHSESQKLNQLYLTEKGDSLETGLWVFEPGANGVVKRGIFKDGFREGIWKYRTQKDSVSIKWIVFTKDSLKLNLPESIKFTKQESPVLFFGKLREDSEHSYYTLLRYNLKEINASVYDYIFQYIQSLENSSVEKLSKFEVKKFDFKKTEVFRVTVNLEGEQKFKAISYIFTSKDILYDLTYREELNRIDDIDLAVFNDILYSFQTNDFDPFNVNNRSYSGEKIIDVKTLIKN